MKTPENHTTHLKNNQSEDRNPWHGFNDGRWQTEIDVRDFIQKNYMPYEGDASFLCDPTERTETLWQKMLELRPFYRSQQIDGDNVDETIKTNGLDFGVFWDNRDFWANPSRGFGLRGKVSRDFGWFDSSDSWTNVEGELDVYIPFQLGDWLRQGVVALDYWTSYSPTWDEQPDGTVDNRPPSYTGSTLGGPWRLRGYPSQRFNDRAAVYYAAELRLIPHWNPFKRWDWLQKYVGIQWLQFVPFVEVGRVAPSWNIETLHTDMKWSSGLGVRAWAKGIVARIDFAASEEDVKVQMMVAQPFQF